MTLRPGETFTIVSQISDANDSATYYPQSIVKNSNSGKTLFTLNLTSSDTKRFTGTFQVPGDSSGLGIFIDVTTTVYTDSGHTTASANYAVSNVVYLVSDHIRTLTGSGGGSSIDYLYIEDILGNRLVKELSGYQKRITSDIHKSIKKPEELDHIPAISKTIEKMVSVLEQSQKKHKESIDRLYGVLSERIEKAISTIENSSKSNSEELSEAISSIESMADGRSNSILESHNEAKKISKDLVRELEGHTVGLKEFTKTMKKELADIFDGIEIVNITRENGIKKKEKYPDVVSILSGL